VRDAVNIPASSLPFMIEELDKSIRYVVYCRFVRPLLRVCARLAC
jgi:hypothetical protein